MRRLFKSRVSVQSLTETQDSVEGTPTKAWTHCRWQKFDIHAASGTRRERMSRAGFVGDWMATGRHKPEVFDGQRIVGYEENGRTITFEVVKVFNLGRHQQILLKELPEAQLTS